MDQQQRREPRKEQGQPRDSACPRVVETHSWLADQVRAELTITDEVGLAMRASRRMMRMSQRRYAAMHGWSASQQARVETRAGDLAVGQVRWMVESTEFVLGIIGEGGTTTITSATDISGWVVEQCTRQGMSTREVADCAGTSQAMVSRARTGHRVDRVSLGAVTDIVRALGGTVRLAWDEPNGPEFLEPAHWPNAAVLPSVRGGARRFPAHEWLRQASGWGPMWYFHRFYFIGDGAHAPLWTAESGVRRGSDSCANTIAPPPPADDTEAGLPLTVGLPAGSPDPVRAQPHSRL